MNCFRLELFLDGLAISSSVPIKLNSIAQLYRLSVWLQRQHVQKVNPDIPLSHDTQVPVFELL